MPNRNDLEGRIISNLAWLSKDITFRGKVNRNDLSVSVEKTVCGLLNRLHRQDGWNLKDMNEEKKNFPGIDLADKKKRMAVQISADNSVGKVKKSLIKFYTHGQDKQFDRLIIFVTKGDASTTTSFTVTVNKQEITVDREDSDAPLKLEIWDMPQIIDQILALDDVARLKEISDYLDGELAYLIRNTFGWRLPQAPKASSSFVKGSRDRELDEILDLVRKEETVFISGIGGMGKTQVAIQLAERWGYKKAYFLRYTLPQDPEAEALRETILQAAFDGYSYRGEDNKRRDDEYAQRLNVLRAYCNGGLLIIDNFDRLGKTLEELQNEAAYDDLLQLTREGMRLVFTTRSPVDAKNAYRLEPISDEALLKLMRRYYHDDSVDDDRLLDLIRAVDGHTLTVELIARTMEELCRDDAPEIMLQALRNIDLDQEDFPDVPNTASQNGTEGQIYGHLKALFDLTGMDEKERDVLRCAALIPDGGMDTVAFQDSLPKDQKRMVSRLKRRGWLQWERKVFSIHPVVREVCWKELGPTAENCGKFLDQLWEFCDYEKDYNAKRYYQMAKCFSFAAEKLGDPQGSWTHHAGRCWALVGDHQTALRYRLQVVQRREKNLPKGHLDIARAYEELGSTYGNLGNVAEALRYKRKAQTIVQKQNPPSYGDLVQVYNSIGVTYADSGNRKRALEFRLKAMEIQESKLPDDKLGLARTYNHVGSAYGELKDHEKAMKYKMDALKIREAELPADHPDLAVSYNNVGSTCAAMGDHEAARNYHEKALKIRKAQLHPNHPHLAISYNNLGHDCAQMKDYVQALDYFEKALAIRKKSLPSTHSKIHRSKDNVAWMKRMIKEQEKHSK